LKPISILFLREKELLVKELGLMLLQKKKEMSQLNQKNSKRVSKETMTQLPVKQLLTNSKL